MAKTRVAINGFGRIGRLVLRAFLEAERDDLEFVAINDLGSAKMNAHLLEYDSIHGHYPGAISFNDKSLTAGTHTMMVFAEMLPEKIPWRDLGVDIVLECTGRFNDRESAPKYLEAGSKRVLVSAPCKEADLTVVYGVNDDILTGEHQRRKPGDIVSSNSGLLPDVRCGFVSIQLRTQRLCGTDATSHVRAPA